jgi:hypothetical protein
MRTQGPMAAMQQVRLLLLVLLRTNSCLHALTHTQYSRA